MCNDEIMSEEFADYIIEYNTRWEALFAEYNATCAQRVSSQFAIIHLPAEGFMDTVDDYDYNMVPKLFTLLDTTSLESTGVLRVRNQPYLSLTGANTIVGIIDTGIDYTHPVFINGNQSTKILSIWDQSIQTGTPPQDFEYGSEYTREMINEALASDDPQSVVPTVDTNGHGTFLAGIAAGNVSDENSFSGVAPNAELVVVKLKPAKQYLRNFYLIQEDVEAYQENDIIQAIHYLTTIALRENKALAICLGLGSNAGSHSGRSYLSTYMSTVAARSGVGMTVAAGNEANNGGHFYATIPDGQEYVELGINVGQGERGFILELWGDAPSLYSIGILSPGGEVINRIQPRLNQIQLLNFLLESTVIYVNYRIVETLTGSQLISMRFSDPTPGLWSLRVWGSEQVGVSRSFNMWLPVRDFIKRDTLFVRPDPDTTITTPADTFIPITVGAYNHHNDGIAIDSSRGYTADGRITPDIAAPGVDVYGPLPRGNFGTLSGTSVAAAHAAGAAALLLEWGIQRGNDITMDSTKIKTYMIRGADRKSSMLYPNNMWGYGTLDVYNIFNSLR